MNPTENERNLIVALLRDKNELIRLRPELTPEYIANPLLSKAWAELIDLADHGFDTDIHTLTNSGKFNDAEKDELWGLYLDDKLGGDPAKGFQRVINSAISRKIERYIKSIRFDNFDAFEYREAASAHITEIENMLSSHMDVSMETILTEFRTHIEGSARGDNLRIPTPWRSLNNALNCGISPTDYIIIGGVPCSGKTTFMLCIALHAAKHGHIVHFIEGEMPPVQLLARLTGIHSGRDVNDIMSGHAMKEAEELIELMSSIPFITPPCSENTFEALQRTVMKAINQGAQLIFVDYLQKYAPVGVNEFSMIKHVSGWLRSIALKHNIAIVAASAFNRNEQNTFKNNSDQQQKEPRQTLASLFGSSSLGHDCKAAILLSSEAVNNIEEAKEGSRRLKVNVAKNRSGYMGVFDLGYHTRNQRIDESLPDITSH
jgi:replicative DNA helicase